MAEVPEHLLQRSRERRIALGLATADGDTAPAAAPAGGGAVAPASAAPAAAPAIAAAPAAPIEVAPPPPPRPRPPATRVPTWVIPALAALPLWGFLYLGIFGERGAEGEPVVSGAQVYSQNCASCHGASGEGGVGSSVGGEAAAVDDLSRRGRPHRVGKDRLSAFRRPALRGPGQDRHRRDAWLRRISLRRGDPSGRHLRARTALGPAP